MKIIILIKQHLLFLSLERRRRLSRSLSRSRDLSRLLGGDKEGLLPISLTYLANFSTTNNLQHQIIVKNILSLLYSKTDMKTNVFFVGCKIPTIFIRLLYFWFVFDQSDGASENF